MHWFMNMQLLDADGLVHHVSMPNSMNEGMLLCAEQQILATVIRCRMEGLHDVLPTWRRFGETEATLTEVDDPVTCLVCLGNER